ncbi:hypothetical protein WA026_012131 [Henosepilachna vigintioctopunctata]|uniref:Uncharacterized protein n=1 Tax=Henosepilachna vigintioctopunctata TaxID=420089 RepID=A0AAW1V526_9CUCU
MPFQDLEGPFVFSHRKHADGSAYYYVTLATFSVILVFLMVSTWVNLSFKLTSNFISMGGFEQTGHIDCPVLAHYFQPVCIYWEFEAVVQSVSGLRTICVHQYEA